ncbi:MAG: SWIM zinc finger family protein [Lutispora sp.]|jgi:uncharacterized Zn finger protein
MTVEPEIFTRLTWGNLEEWAGAKTLTRGRRYQEEGRVRDLARLPEGDLIAWVVGTRRYATVVSSDGESIESWCTCPVGESCKHAVAVVLEYLESVKSNRPTPTASAGDPRLQLLSMEIASPSPDLSLRSYLEGLTKDELINLIETLSLYNPDVRTAINDRRSVAREGAGPIASALLSEIDAITDEEPWGESWGHGIPDYSSVQEKIGALLSMGHVDEVVMAGKVLLQKGTRQLETIDDEGETFDQIAECMDMVFSALAATSWPGHEKILYVIDARLEDEYDLCRDAWKVFEEDFPQEEWSIVADRLLERLEEISPARDSGNATSKYRRGRLVTVAAMALDRAGRQDEATDLQISEADRTDAYPAIVLRLLNEGRQDEAIQWIYRGIAKTGEEAPGIAERLRAILREIWEREGNWPGVTAIYAEAFLRDPTCRAFKELEEAARRAGVHDEVRDAAMHYLVTGEDMLSGILPDVGVRSRGPRWRVVTPVTDTLIEIAIAEEKPDEILRWYDQWREDEIDPYLRHNLEDRIADAIVSTYPERAIAIWKKKAERLIAEVQRRSYETSLRYLRRLQSHMPPAEWEEYREDLRRKHARKRRFLEVLDRVEDQRIIEGD